MIRSFYLDEEPYKYYKVHGNNFHKLDNLSRINIFIGSNNSGKSRLLRNLFADETINYTNDEVDLKQINFLITRLKSELTAFSKKQLGNHEEFLNQTVNKLENIHSVSDGINLNTLVRQNIYNIANFQGSIHSNHGNNETYVRREIIEIAKRYLYQFDMMTGDFPTDFKLRNIYIPTLRGMRKIDSSDKDLYLSATINDYFNTSQTGNVESKIITGLKLNEEIREHLLGSRTQRKQVRNFENFLSAAFFNGNEVNIIPKTKGGVIHFMIDHEEKEIYNLGDGIQSIIILTYPLFFNQDKKMNFFIEEPEHYLHPGFQRIFIETLLLPQFVNFQYFITTHSNHLLDITLDTNQISVYTFKRKLVENNETNFIIENVENEDVSTLELIGVRNSSLFLSNSTIWVEGITDRIYLRKYLDIIQKDEKNKFIEDIHYSFVEYGGGNITHWSFLEDSDKAHRNIEVERLCAKLFLITDKDDTTDKTSKKAQRQVQLSEKLGDRYYCLDSIEIENILSPNVIKNVIRNYEKHNTQLTFNESFVSEHYKNEHLGTFIDKNITGRNRTYADKSGTIKDKVNFAKSAVSFINEISDMSEEAIKLSEKLYSFIASQNV